MPTRPLLIAGALLLGSALAAQTPPGRPSTTSPGASPDRTVDPNAPATPTVSPSSGSPAPSDVHEAPPPMETSAPPAAAPPSDGKTDSKPAPGDRPK